jgi:DedD protein
LIAGRTTAKREAQSEKAASLGPVTERSIVDKEQGKSSVESVSLPKDKPAEPKAPPALREKLEDSNEAGPAADRLTEAPVASAAPLIETSQTKELPVIQTKEVVVGKQESAHRDTDSASLEQKKTESEYVASTGDLASLPVSPMMPTIANAPKVMASKEQALLESKPAKTALGEQSVTKVLQGFVIQLAFAETRDARLWAETLERRGFAVSLTEAGGSGSVRVRIGNFAGREEAERQLQALRRDGLKGIILNLPQAYRPEVHPGVTEENGKAVSVVQ